MQNDFQEGEAIPADELQDKLRKKPSWLKRVGWLIAIWALSILVLIIITFGIKLIMRAVGLHT